MPDARLERTRAAYFGWGIVLEVGEFQFELDGRRVKIVVGPSRHAILQDGVQCRLSSNDAAEQRTGDEPI